MKLPTTAQYTYLTDDEREKLYQQYCKKNGLDPNLEYSIYEFFDTIDKREEDEETTDDPTDLIDLDSTGSTLEC